MNTQHFPTLDQLNEELNRTRQQGRCGHILRGFAFAFLAILGVALIALFALFSVIRVQGSAMSPTLRNGDVVVAFQYGATEKGDLATFYFNDKTLVKRVIATSGDEVIIQSDGSVLVNGTPLHEAYVANSTPGECDITFPYTVPNERIFVLGDERSVSLDSRHSIIGCIAPEQVTGRAFIRIWPLNRFGLIP